jgi:hypothetical protein
MSYRKVLLATALSFCLILASCSSTKHSSGSNVPVGTGTSSSSSGNLQASWVRLPPNFYGINFPSSGFEIFAHTPFAQLLSQLYPRTLRFPGGTGADYYNWHTGLVNEPGVNNNQSVPFTLQDLYLACQATRAVPIFDLNVLSPANRLDPSDQIAMLKAAAQMGLPIKYVEIGNELYSNAPGVQQAFPNGAIYAKTVVKYVVALHSAFPGVQVAADALGQPLDSRQENWNSQLIENATGPGAPDAFIIHDYPGQYFTSLTSSNLPQVLASAYTGILQLNQEISALGDKPVWLTEYNLRGPYNLARRYGTNPAEKTYAHELFLAAFAAMLPRISHLALVDNWEAFGDGQFGAWQDPNSPSLSPGGQAIALVYQAALGATRAGPIQVSSVPFLGGSSPGVIGELFEGPGGSQSGILVNLTPNLVNLHNDLKLPATTSYMQVTGNPLQVQPIANAPLVGHVGISGLSLPGYSVIYFKS